jgi:Domain of unknown function (DUF4253)
MINSIAALTDFLQGTILADRNPIQLPIPETDEVAFAIQVGLEDGINAWQVMRECLDQTQRWPVLIACWQNSYNLWEQNVVDNDLFSRFYFAEEDVESSPASVIARAARVDLSAFMEARANLWIGDLEAELDFWIDQIRAAHDQAPPRSQLIDLINASQFSNLIELEQWLFNWESQNLNLPRLSPQDLSYLEGFEPRGQHLALILLPTAQGWESLAYLNFFGGYSAEGIALLKKWQQHYQAELVCHYGTMLQFQVGLKPATPEAAFELAWEQIALAPCTIQLPGISIREHARALLQCDRWFLHERP